MRAQITTEPSDPTALIRDTIDDFFRRRIELAGGISPYYKNLWDDMYRLIGAGGKRLRPRLTILAYEAFGGLDIQSVVPIASAQELLHLSMLIHDDIIDRDYIRYGVDNIAGSYNILYEPFVSDTTDRLHYARSTALLAGDLLISGSFELIAESNMSKDKIFGAQQLLSKSIFEVVGGELLDTEAAFREFGDISAETVARYKTASYSFAGPLLTGALLADSSYEDNAHLQSIAENLGIAYQLVDDIISIFGTQEDTGKPTIGDIREGKRTYMVEQFYALATETDRHFFDTLFGDTDITLDQVEEIKQLLISSGARQKTEEAIARFESDARTALEALQLTPPFYNRFNDLISSVTKRDR